MATNLVIYEINDDGKKFAKTFKNVREAVSDAEAKALAKAYEAMTTLDYDSTDKVVTATIDVA